MLADYKEHCYHVHVGPHLRVYVLLLQSIPTFLVLLVTVVAAAVEGVRDRGLLAFNCARNRPASHAGTS